MCSILWPWCALHPAVSRAAVFKLVSYCFANMGPVCARDGGAGMCMVKKGSASCSAKLIWTSGSFPALGKAALLFAGPRAIRPLGSPSPTQHPSHSPVAGPGLQKLLVLGLQFPKTLLFLRDLVSCAGPCWIVISLGQSGIVAGPPL